MKGRYVPQNIDGLGLIRIDLFTLEQGGLPDNGRLDIFAVAHIEEIGQAEHGQHENGREARDSHHTFIMGVFAYPHKPAQLNTSSCSESFSS
jgi:hypothetical protein